MKKIRIGILGQGFIGQIHREVLSELENYEIVCVSDLNKDSLGNLLDVKVFEDYRELLNPEHRNLDAVVNALPTALHVQSVKDTASRGLSMLLEKPMGINSEEAEKIKKTATSSKVKLMIGMTGRYHPEFVKAYESIEQIGDIISFEEKIHIGGTPFPTQYLDKNQCGRGVGLTNGIHTIDRFIWYMGKDIEEVNIESIGNEGFKRDVEDNVKGKVRFSNGKTGGFSLRWYPDKEFDYIFKAKGTEGDLEVHGLNFVVLTKEGKKTELYRHNQEVDFRERHKPGIKAELEAFAEFLKGDEQTKHVEDCIKAQKVIDQFYG